MGVDVAEWRYAPRHGSAKDRFADNITCRTLAMSVTSVSYPSVYIHTLQLFMKFARIDLGPVALHNVLDRLPTVFNFKRSDQL